MVSINRDRRLISGSPTKITVVLFIPLPSPSCMAVVVVDNLNQAVPAWLLRSFAVTVAIGYFMACRNVSSDFDFLHGFASFHAVAVRYAISLTCSIRALQS